MHNAPATLLLTCLLAPGCYQGTDRSMGSGFAEDPGADAGGESTNGVSDGAPSDSDGPESPQDDGPGLDDVRLPFHPLPPSAALAKVKDFVTGLPPTAQEHEAYLEDPTRLPSMIAQWQQSPQGSARLTDVLRQLLQQETDVANLAEYTDLPPFRLSGMELHSEGRLFSSIADSFIATAQGLVERGRPFTEILTTRRVMLNVPQMVLLAYLDGAPRADDASRLPSWLEAKYPDVTFNVVWPGVGDPIPLAESLDPASPNFMTFWLDEAPTGSCVDDNARTYRGRFALRNALFVLFRMTAGNVACALAPQVFTDDDWALREVTLRTPASGEEPAEFFDVDSLRNADELVLTSDRVGFFTTLGFSSKWVTNDSNQHRVTANQTLIVGLGRTFDPENLFIPADDASVDADHAQPGTPCYGCHKDLDPLRDFIRQSYTYAGSARPAESLVELPATAFFSVDGSAPVAGFGVGDLARAMAAHPRFAAAWVEKVCQLVNAGACLPSDPVLTAVAQRFASSGHDFRSMLADLLASPVVTFAERTATSDEFGVVVPPVTQDRFCLRMSQRLGVADLCNLTGAGGAPTETQERLKALADGIPVISFARAAVAPFVATVPDVFSAGSIAKVCQVVSERWLQDRDDALWTPAQREAALDAFVGEIMGIPPSDPRAAPLREVLDRHWTAAVDAGAEPDDALRSTFITACSSAPAAATSL